MAKKTKKHPGGRPTKYKPSYCAEIIKYFDVDPVIYKDITVQKLNSKGEVTETVDKTVEESIQIPMLCKFAKEKGVDTATLWRWTEKYPEFRKAYNTAKEFQLNVLIQNALRNNYSSYFAFQMAKNMFGWRDKQEIETTRKVEILLD